MLSRRPKPATSSAVQPAMPITVMKKRFLYRSRLRTVTFCVNFRRFHSGVIRSRNTRFPALGARGCSRRAGDRPSECRQAEYVAARHSRIAAADDSAAYPQWKGVSSGGRVYIIS